MRDITRLRCETIYTFERDGVDVIYMYVHEAKREMKRFCQSDVGFFFVGRAGIDAFDRFDKKLIAAPDAR